MIYLSISLLLILSPGGGSQLLPSPADGISLDDLITISRNMSYAGALAMEKNTVLKHIEQLKGGKMIDVAKPAKVKNKTSPYNTSS